MGKCQSASADCSTVPLVGLPDQCGGGGAEPRHDGFIVASLGGMWASVDGKTWVGGENDMSESTPRPGGHPDDVLAVLPFRGSLWAVERRLGA